MKTRPKSSSPRIVIIGAGPCGIGAAWRLWQQGHPNWAIFEQNDYVGGLSASFRDKEGFTWDIGGHVLFSRHAPFSRFITQALPPEALNHWARDTWLYVDQRWVPYPLQNNIHYLALRQYQACCRSLDRRPAHPQRGVDLANFLRQHFGTYLADRYLIPMNRKMWSTSVQQLSAQWTRDRVSSLKTAASRPTDRRPKRHQWGPNHAFDYPRHGGIGEIYRRGVQPFQTKIKTNHRAMQIDVSNKMVTFQNGQSTPYDYLIYTGDVRRLVNMLKPAVRNEIRDSSRRLMATRLYVIGLGLNRPCNDRRSWLYFPQDESPFFRVTHLSNYSPHVCPSSNGRVHSSLLVEISLSADASVQSNALIERSIRALMQAGLLTEYDRRHPASIYEHSCSEAYPIPTLDRDQYLKTINAYLRHHQIYAQGRLGAFRYESGNMDDCFMQGYHQAQELCKR